MLKSHLIFILFFPIFLCRVGDMPGSVRFYAIRVEQNICKFGNEMCCMQIPFNNNKHEKQFCSSLQAGSRRSEDGSDTDSLAAVHKVNGPRNKIEICQDRKTNSHSYNCNYNNLHRSRRWALAKRPSTMRIQIQFES